MKSSKPFHVLTDLELLQHIKQRLSAEADDLSSLSGSDCPDSSSVEDLSQLEELRLCQSAQSLDIKAHETRKHGSMETDDKTSEHFMPHKRWKTE